MASYCLPVFKIGDQALGNKSVLGYGHGDLVTVLNPDDWAGGEAAVSKWRVSGATNYEIKMQSRCIASVSIVTGWLSPK